jgi:toxin-antitoxin system PIN domain toxin
VIVLDVNVLLAAYREDHVHHGIVAPWLSSAADAGETFLAPDLVWIGFLRLVTNSQVFPVPAAPGQALAFVTASLASDSFVTVASPTDWSQFARTALEADARANLIPDAYIASIALAHGAPVATLDRDFRRFTGLRIIEPSADRT